MPHYGFTERRGVDGRTRHRARVYHDGRRISETFDTLPQALAWRASTIARVEQGEAPEPVATQTALPASPATAVTVAAAARMLCTGVVAGHPHPDRDGVQAERRPEDRGGAPRPRPAANRRDAPRRGLEGRRPGGSSTTSPPRRAPRRRGRRSTRSAPSTASPSGTASPPRTPVRASGKPAGDPERPARFLTAAESHRLVQAAETIDAEQCRSLGGPLLRLVLDTGLRLGELLGLVWADVNLDGRGTAAAPSRSRRRPPTRSAGTGSPRDGRPTTCPYSPARTGGRSTRS
jgi:hypothetical protein